ncbi:LysM peptidoglycan-binding domain-containing protein [Domibacillus sp. A3M-37]|uniref:LysM peptidoglycan-binding domain-containing protein n=1 Tax=Domibacillus sp. A3M-37 TaxID=2962037 RepID=UPI0020B8139E|nr:LysM peptidoglycan-binding domain-containing protein [Domibacillus sp. A3M-37]MCP3761272.1 LysM peptidoglycan-binding domain-containing protein [Domibacillus sp. A3M-37]
MKKQIMALAATTVIGGSVFGTAASASSYTVQSGDTLWSISQKTGTTVDQLKSSNGLSSNMIYVGETIQTSGSGSTAAASSNGTYTVKAGDTLYKIATAQGISVDSLKSINGLSSNMIYPGDQLSTNGSAAPAKAASAPQSTQAAAEPAQTSSAPQGKTLTMTATAYTAECAGCSGVTATGIDLRNAPNKKVIAVDPGVIPLGSRVYVEGYGEAVAGDTGGAIKGNKIDLHVPNNDAAYNWGVRTVNVTILD